MSPCFARRMKQAVRLGLCAVGLVASSHFPVSAAGSKATDENIEAVRELFEETSHGTPGERFQGDMSALKQSIDLDFVKRLYQVPNAMDAIQEVFTGSEYAEINRRVGQIRNEVNLRIWASIAKEYDIPVELNDAGKKNGALSDLDKFLAANGDRLAGVERAPRDIHAYLIEEHRKRWRQQMGVDPASYDVMHFSSSGLMKDWRMSNSHWSEFGLELDRSIAALAGTDGAYFVPGGYKTQVYTRYHLEGKTTRIEPHLNPESDPRHVKDIVDLAEGVLVTEDLPTSTNSRLYGAIPFDIDRTGALGSALQNYIAAIDTSNAIKNAKYNNRWVDTALVHLTNLEVDFRRLILEGNHQILDYHIDKLFLPMADEAGIIERVGDRDEVKRIIETLARIELDKVIRGLGSERPDHWTSEWQNYEPRDINEAQVKLDYFAAEIVEIREAFTSEEWNQLPDEEKAALGEREFRRKAHEIGRVGATIAARRVFRDIFTYNGFSKLRKIHGPEQAKRLVTERVKELHAALIFIEDRNLINRILAEAPSETRRSLSAIADIADAQRAEVLEMKSRVERVSDELENVKRITRQAYVDDLAQKLNDDNHIIKDLINILDMPEMARISPADIARGTNIPGAYRLRLGDLAFEYARQEISANYGEAVRRMIQEGQITLSQNRQEAYAATRRFFDQGLPDSVRPTALLSGTLENFKDVGTVEAASKVFAAYLKGDYVTMQQEARDAVLGNVPVGGTAYGFAKAIKDYEQGKSTPLVMFTAQQLLSRTVQGAKYGALLGVLNTIYGIEQTLMDIGWTVVGQPTQDAAVSYILMGDLSAVEEGNGGGALPLFNQETIQLLRDNAILRKRVDDGDLSYEAKKQILRSHFLARANRHATSLGRSAPGQFTDWEQDRERYLQQEFFNKHEYWMRRLNFYQETHIDVFSWVQQNTLDDNWQRIDAEPPAYLSGSPKEQLMEDWGFAYTKTRGDKGYWDHEKVWLHRYFARWVSEWEQTQPEFGEFMYYLNTRAFTGDWRAAVTRKLVSMFQEGELYDYSISQAKAQSNPAWGKAFENLQQNVDSRLNQVGEKIMTERGTDRLHRFMAMEQLYWHPEIEKRILVGFEQALDREPEYEPIDPELQVNLPRTVARMGTPLKGDFTVIGDPELIPEDLEIEVSYEPVQTWERDRPSAVLDDHLLTAFGSVIEDEDLIVVKHKAVFKATSASTSGFNLRDEQTVYWLDYHYDSGENEEDSDENAEDEDGSDEGDAPTLTQDEIDGLTGLIGGQLAKIQSTCQQGLEHATAARDGFRSIGNEIETLSGRIDGAMSRIQVFAADHSRLSALLSAANDAANLIATRRDEMEHLKNRICSLATEYAQSTSREDQKAILDSMRDLLEDAKATKSSALTEITELQEYLGGINKIRDDHRGLALEIQELEESFSRISDSYEEAVEQLEKADELQSGAVDGIAQLELLRDRALEMLTRASQIGSTEMINAVEAQIVRIDQALEDARDCPVKLNQRIGEAALSRQEASTHISALRERIDAVRFEFEAITTAAQIDAVYQEADGLRSIIRLFWESIENRFNDMIACMDWAKDQEITRIRVPNLTGMKATNAVQALERVGLGAKVIGGDPAPTLTQQYTVQDQTPVAGGQIDAGGTVSFRVYGELAITEKTVPNVLNMKVRDAMTRLRSAGFRPVVVGGDPASNPSLVHTVQSQSLRAGTREQEGTSITLRVRGDYDEPEEAPNMQPSPEPAPQPRPQPRPSRDPDPAPSNDSIDDQSSGAMYVIFDVWRPDVLDDKPEDVKYSDWLKRLTIHNVRYEKAEDRFLAFKFYPHVSGSKPIFKPGERYSMRVNFTVHSIGESTALKMGNKRKKARGALLLSVRSAYDSFGEMKAQYPKVKAPENPMKDFDTVMIINAYRKGGARFQSDEGHFVLAIDWIEKGWPDTMRALNLDLMREMAEIFDCFIATAALRGAIQSEPLSRLRAFRDDVLGKTDTGQRFIELYYEQAPELALKVWRDQELADRLGHGVRMVSGLTRFYDHENPIHRLLLEFGLKQVNQVLEKRSSSKSETSLLAYPLEILSSTDARMTHETSPPSTED